MGFFLFVFFSIVPRESEKTRVAVCERRLGEDITLLANGDQGDAEPPRSLF